MVESIAIYVVVLGVGTSQGYYIPLHGQLICRCLKIFFFWNRILGLIVGFCLRRYMWKTADAHISIGMPLGSRRDNFWLRKVRFLIGSLQISPLAGRILFKDVRYHSTNMSARVLLGHITWRYWKWRVRKEDSNGEQFILLDSLFRASADIVGSRRNCPVSMSDTPGRSRVVPVQQDAIIRCDRRAYARGGEEREKHGSLW